MNLGLTDRAVVVTGGASGIGLAVVEAFLAEGAHVVAGDIAIESLHGLEPSLGTVHSVEVDLRTADGCARLVNRAIQLEGGIDVLVNNVGLVGGHRTSFLEVTDEAWHETLELNLMSFVRTTRAALPHMLDRASGSIVSVASDIAREPNPFFVDYGVSKAAVVSLSKSLSIELGPRGIRSNVVSPGPTRTPGLVEFFQQSVGPDWGMTGDAAIEHFVHNVRRVPLQRLGEPADVAAAVLFLASERAKYVTGSEYCVNGGVLSAA
jgi:NAD(P)-dependent dehydrogenase (short-subunit alcohol dehydrogenase family)